MISYYFCAPPIQVWAEFLDRNYNSQQFFFVNRVVQLRARQLMGQITNGLKPGALILLEDSTNREVGGVSFEYELFDLGEVRNGEERSLAKVCLKGIERDLTIGGPVPGSIFATQGGKRESFAGVLWHVL